MAKEINLQQLYDDTFSKVYNDRLLELETILNLNDGVSFIKKLGNYRDLISGQYSLYSKGTKGTRDDFFEDISLAFNDRHQNYSRDYIKLFFERDFVIIKEKYKNKIDSINNPAIYSYSAEKFTIYLATYWALLKFFNNSYCYNPDNLKSAKEIIENIPLGKLNLGDNSGNNNNVQQIEVSWTNGNNKNDFVKIIYGLHKAGLINDGRGDITKIVEYLGEGFNVGLSKSWQSNFSKNKNSRNNDYDSFEIFDKLKEAYKGYLKEKDK